MAVTYDFIKQVNISGNPTGVSITDIPQTYTDLRIIVKFDFNDAYGNYNYACYVNGASPTHSTTVLGSAGSSSSSARQSNVSAWLLSFPTGSPTEPWTGTLDIELFNYTSPYNKTGLIRTGVPKSSAPGLQLGAVLAQTSGGIYEFTLIGNTGSTLQNGTLILYGIKAA